MRIAILVLLLVMGKVVCAQPFAMNGWQFHERNVPKLAEAVRKAPEYGVNFFIFSHEFFDHVEEFLNSPERQRDVLYIGSLADQQKIPWYLWAHEFDDIPERFMVKSPIRPDDPRMSAAALWNDRADENRSRGLDSDADEAGIDPAPGFGRGPSHRLLC